MELKINPIFSSYEYMKTLEWDVDDLRQSLALLKRNSASEIEKQNMKEKIKEKEAMYEAWSLAPWDAH